MQLIYIYRGREGGSQFSYLRGRNFAEITFRKFFFSDIFWEFGLRKDFTGINFHKNKYFAGRNFIYAFRNIFPWPYYMVLRMISVKIITFLPKWQNNRWCWEDPIQKTLYPIETVNIQGSLFLEIFRVIDVCESPILRWEGGPGSKKQVWLISKSKLSLSYSTTLYGIIKS